MEGSVGQNTSQGSNQTPLDQSHHWDWEHDDFFDKIFEMFRGSKSEEDVLRRMFSDAFEAGIARGIEIPSLPISDTKISDDSEMTDVTLLKDDSVQLAEDESLGSSYSNDFVQSHPDPYGVSPDYSASRRPLQNQYTDVYAQYQARARDAAQMNMTSETQNSMGFTTPSFSPQNAVSTPTLPFHPRLLSPRPQVLLFICLTNCDYRRRVIFNTVITIVHIKTQCILRTAMINSSIGMCSSRVSDLTDVEFSATLANVR